MVVTTTLEDELQDKEGQLDDWWLVLSGVAFEIVATCVC